MKQLRKYRVWFVLFLMIAAATDRVLKKLTGTETDLTLIPGILSLTWTKNTGISFSMFADSNLVLTVITSLIVCGVLIYTVFRKPGILRQCALGLIAGGAIGNIIDRISVGFVHDMIRFDFIHFPVFNMADCCIVTGAVILAFSVIFDKDSRENGKK